MKLYSVQELASLSGISVRTLHYYDEVGLLVPHKRTDSNYRFYSEEELYRLQQILFYKELGFPLKEIKILLSKPGFSLIEALKEHKTSLQERKARISQLLVTIDKTIRQIKTGEAMKDASMLYEGLPKEVGTTFRDEAIEAYGQQTVEKSEKDLMKLGKSGFAALKKEQDEITSQLFEIKEMDPTSPKVQVLVGEHFEIIKKFWGTSDLGVDQKEVYGSLGDLYVSDERYTMVDGIPQPAFARFLRTAMQHFVKHTKM